MMEKKYNKFGKLMIATILGVVLLTTLLSGCIENNGGGADSKEIVVISRESTSGTREFFWENVLEKEDFYADAIEKTSNGEVHDTVASTPLAIGYVGLGYLDNDVKAIKVDGTEVSVESVLDGSYPISRELYMFTKGDATDIAKDFIEFLMSTEGQEIVEQKGFVPLATTDLFNSTGRATTGTLDISGSTTVLPIALAIQEEYVKMYPDLTINIAGPGSSAGIAAVSDPETSGVEIGMASRDLKESEKTLGLVKHVICSDGIAIVVHPNNDYIENDDITLEQLKTIYTSGGDWLNI